VGPINAFIGKSGAEISEILSNPILANNFINRQSTILYYVLVDTVGLAGIFGTTQIVSRL
jgi:hypothetical protein